MNSDTPDSTSGVSGGSAQDEDISQTSDKLSQEEPEISPSGVRQISPKRGHGGGADLPWWLKERNVKWERAGSGWAKWRITYTDNGTRQKRNYAGWLSGSTIKSMIERMDSYGSSNTGALNAN